MALRQRLRRRLGREARRGAAVLGRVARQFDPPPDPAPPAPADGGGPPDHWLAVVRARAPQLLEGRGIGARVAERPVSRAAVADELDFAAVVDPLATSRAAFAGAPGAAGEAGTRPGSWAELPAGRPTTADRWDELGASRPEADGSWDAVPARRPEPAAWAAPPDADPVPAAGWPTAAEPPCPQADWPGAAARPQDPLQWAEPAPGQAQRAAPWPTAAGPVPVATAWPDRWTEGPAHDHVRTDGAGAGLAMVVADTTGPPPVLSPDVAFDDQTGPWPDLPPIDIAVPGTGPTAPVVPAHGPFDRARVARLDAEQLGAPLDGAR